MQYHSDRDIQARLERIEGLLAAKDYQHAADMVAALQEQTNRKEDYVAEAAVAVYSGILELAAGNIENSIALREKALAIGLAHYTPYYTMRAYNGLAAAYSERGDYYPALGNYLNAYRIAAAHPDFSYEAVILNNLGYLFIWLEEYETAAGYFTNAYDNYLERKSTDRTLLVDIIRNLVEAWSCAGDYGEAKTWAANLSAEMTPAEQLTLDCMLLASDAQMNYEEGDFDAANSVVRAFLDKARGNAEFMYMFRSALNIAHVAIELNDYDLATEALQALVELDQKAELATFRFRFAELRVDYYRRFLKETDGGKYADDFYEYYLFHSMRMIDQLKQGYLNNLMVELALDKSQHIDNSALRKGLHLKDDQELDPLTKLLNRVSFQRYASEKLATRREGERQCLLLVHIDSFKELNDAYGHHFGDMLLLELADILTNLARGNAVLGRFSGGEFLIFVNYAREPERIRERVAGLLERAEKIALPDEVNGPVTFSIGAYFIETEITYEDALSRAQKGLDAAAGVGMERYTVAP